MAKNIESLFRKKLAKRKELMRQVREIDVELEAMQAVVGPNPFMQEPLGEPFCGLPERYQPK